MEARVTDGDGCHVSNDRQLPENLIRGVLNRNHHFRVVKYMIAPNALGPLLIGGGGDAGHPMITANPCLPERVDFERGVHSDADKEECNDEA